MDRGSGILLPVFSLPSKYGIGTFGKEAFRFIKFLQKSGQKYWQMLPLNPTSYGDSPYQSFSAFALNPYFIDLDVLIKKNYLTKTDVKPLNHHYKRSIDYGEEYEKRYLILEKAFKNSFYQLEAKILKFKKANKFWVNDYALFMVIKEMNGGTAWSKWPKDLKMRKKSALNKVIKEKQEQIDFWIWCQFMADFQYRKLRKFAKEHNVKIFGDMPIYVAMDSADVWANYRYFQLDKNRNPAFVAGVPPDYFSKTGQLWGNPIYDWDKMAYNNFRWWKKRVSKCSKYFDLLRIDHFRGIDAYWSISAEETTAINGKWIKGPGIALINAIKSSAKGMKIIAEDLGFLTEDVRGLKQLAGWPGLCIYEFGFDSGLANDSYLPENYKPDCVAYIGTHDNDTLLHFIQEKKKIYPYMMQNLKIDNMSEAFDKMIERMFDSKADIVIFTMQDMMKEGGEYRINTPGTATGNWHYRLDKNYCNDTLANWMNKMTKKALR